MINELLNLKKYVEKTKQEVIKLTKNKKNIKDTLAIMLKSRGFDIVSYKNGYVIARFGLSGMDNLFNRKDVASVIYFDNKRINVEYVPIKIDIKKRY